MLLFDRLALARLKHGSIANSARQNLAPGRMRQTKVQKMRVQRPKSKVQSPGRKVQSHPGTRNRKSEGAHLKGAVRHFEESDRGCGARPAAACAIETKR